MMHLVLALEERRRQIEIPAASITFIFGFNFIRYARSGITFGPLQSLPKPLPTPGIR